MYVSTVSLARTAHSHDATHHQYYQTNIDSHTTEHFLSCVCSASAAKGKAGTKPLPSFTTMQLASGDLEMDSDEEAAKGTR